MKTPEQLKQWVRSAGRKRVIIRQWSTPEQEEFMRDSPSKREFDRLHKLLVFCDTDSEIERIKEMAAASHVIDGLLCAVHVQAVMQLADQYKLQMKERRTIKGWWRNANDQERFAASLIAGIVGTFTGGTALACLILFVIR